MKYVVQCVRERLPWALELRDRLGAHLYLDMAQAPMRAFCSSLMMHGGEGHIHLEDDVELCSDFEERVEEAVSQYPNDVIKFFPNLSRSMPPQPEFIVGSGTKD